MSSDRKNLQLALVTLARAAGMLKAFAGAGDFIGHDAAEEADKMTQELDAARELVRVGLGLS